MKWFSLLRPLEILQVWFIGVFACVIIGAPPSLQTGLYLLALLLHISGTYFLNDYFDWEADRANPRRATFKERPFALWLLGLATILFSSVIAFAITIKVGLIFLTLNFLGLGYSMPPFRLKAHRPYPILIHAICGAFYFGGTLLALQVIPQMSHALYTAFWAIILASGSLFNEVLDSEPDKASGVQTLGQKLAFPKAKLFLTAVHGLALVVYFLALWLERLNVSLVVGILSFCVYLIWLIRLSTSLTPSDYRKVYRCYFAALTLVTFAEAATRFYF